MSAQLPDELHRLKGTRPTRAAAPGDSQFHCGRPKMPKYLSDEEKECWRGIVKLLAARGTLTAAEAPAIEIYAQTKARHLALLRELKQYGEMVETTVLDNSGTPHTKRVANPASKLATSLANSLRAMLKELCATIASRERARPTAPAKPKEVEKTPEELELEAGNAFLRRK
jgi:P27 family predicted phage terminase small subunit